MVFNTNIQLITIHSIVYVKCCDTNSHCFAQIHCFGGRGTHHHDMTNCTFLYSCWLIDNDFSKLELKMNILVKFKLKF